MRIRSVASLPDELEDPDEMEDASDDDNRPMHLHDGGEDTGWGAAFEVDDYRAAKDPDADLLTGPARVRMMPATAGGDEDGELLGMPEEGDEPERTGVGEQVSLPDGFGDDLMFGEDEPDEAPDVEEPTASAAPLPPPAPFSPSFVSRSPPPRVLTEDPVEGLAVAWMSSAEGGTDDLPDILEEPTEDRRSNQEARLALLETAVLGEAQKQTGQMLEVAAPSPVWSPESAPGPDSIAPQRAPSSLASPRGRLPSPQGSLGDPAGDLIPDAVSALAEALERDSGPQAASAPRPRRPSGEPPRISRRTREEPAPPPPARPASTTLPPGQRTVPARPPKGPADPRRLARPALTHPEASEHEVALPRRIRPPPGEPPAARPGRADALPPLPPAPPGPRQLSPVVMPASTLAPADGDVWQQALAPPPAAPVSAEAFGALLDRPSPPRTASPARSSARGAPRAVRAPAPARPAQREVSPLLIGLALVVGILGLVAVAMSQLRPDPSDSRIIAADVPLAPLAPGVEIVDPLQPATVLPAPPVATPVPAGTPPVAGADRTSAVRVALGIIRVESDRKALIIIDGKQQGYAGPSGAGPALADVTVMPGQHTVRAVISGAGLSKSMEIRVDAGTAVVASFVFAK